MSIQTRCPTCKAQFQLDDDLAGETVRCQDCQGIFEVPKPRKKAAPEEFVPAEIVEEPIADTSSTPPPKRAAVPNIAKPAPPADVKPTMIIAVFLVMGLTLLSCLVCFLGVGWWYLSLQGSDVNPVAAQKKDEDKAGGAAAEKPKAIPGEKGKGIAMPPPPPPFPKAMETIVIFQPDGSFRTQSGLVATDPFNRDLKHYRGYRVVLEAGMIYQIDMTSNDLDSYLYLVDDKGLVVAKDDNGGDKRDARIVYAPTRAGSFRIETTSARGNELGAFTLSVRRIQK